MNPFEKGNFYADSDYLNADAINIGLVSAVFGKDVSVKKFLDKNFADKSDYAGQLSVVQRLEEQARVEQNEYDKASTKLKKYRKVILDTVLSRLSSAQNKLASMSSSPSGSVSSGAGQAQYSQPFNTQSTPPITGGSGDMTGGDIVGTGLAASTGASASNTDGQEGVAASSEAQGFIAKYKKPLMYVGGGILVLILIALVVRKRK